MYWPNWREYHMKMRKFKYFMPWIIFRLSPQMLDFSPTHFYLTLGIWWFEFKVSFLSAIEVLNIWDILTNKLLRQKIKMGGCEVLVVSK